MSRRKSEVSSRQNERDFPHLVELPVPLGGFGQRLWQFDAFHRERGIPVRNGRGRQDEGQFFIRYCFADATHADAFHGCFGGERLKRT
jgi:hypothetical protein